MASNIIKISGRITHDLQLQTSSNTNFLNFTIAHTHGFGDKAITMFFKCVCFGRTAEFITKHFSKGSGIIITGDLRNNNYEKNGQKHYNVDINVSSVDFMDGAASINTVLLTGNLVAEPQTKLNTGDKSIARFLVAARKNYKVAENKPTADFINVVTFGKQAETVAKYLSKGSKVDINGYFSVREYELKDESGTSVKKYQYDVIVNQFGVSFLDKKNKETENTPPISNPQPQYSHSPTPAPSVYPYFSLEEDDDLPF